MTASLSIYLVIAEGGIKLIGYLMKTQFPLSLEIKYGKLPVKEMYVCYNFWYNVYLIIKR